jgi:hypothetical protein
MISSSTISIYDILGYSDPRVQDPLSREKLVTLYSWLRKILGYIVNSRTMTFELSEERQQVLIKVIGEWKDKKSYRLVDAAQLHGMLESASQACRWAHPYFFAVENTLRDDIYS